MSWKSRTSIGILTATVVTGAGAATMANALASAQPPPPTVSVATTVPTALATELPADELRTQQLARSVEDLLAQIGVLEKAVAAGSATPGPTARSGRAGSAAGPTGAATTEAEPADEPTTAGPTAAGPTSAAPTTAPPQDDRRAPTEHPSETPEPPEPFHD